MLGIPAPDAAVKILRRVYDLHQVVLELTVPPKAKSLSFDSDGNSIEVDNNYFQNPFHPIPNFGIYDSLVILDNVQWHDYEAVGTTDPLN